MRRRLELILEIAIAIVLLGCRSGNTDAAPSLSCVPFVLEERPGPKCPSYDGAVRWQEWEDAWRLGSAFECNSTRSKPGGEWQPRGSDGRPVAVGPVLELFDDGFVVRIHGREEPWRARAVRQPAPGPAWTRWACPWQRDGDCLLLHFDSWTEGDGRLVLQVLSDDLRHIYGVERWVALPEPLPFSN